MRADRGLALIAKLADVIWERSGAAASIRAIHRMQICAVHSRVEIIPKCIEANSLWHFDSRFDCSSREPSRRA
jgi:hypothetical protein